MDRFTRVDNPEMAFHICRTEPVGSEAEAAGGGPLVEIPRARQIHLNSNPPLNAQTQFK